MFGLNASKLNEEMLRRDWLLVFVFLLLHLSAICSSFVLILIFYGSVDKWYEMIVSMVCLKSRMKFPKSMHEKLVKNCI